MIINRSLVFSFMVGVLLTTLGFLLAKSAYIDWSLCFVGLGLLSISLLSILKDNQRQSVSNSNKYLSANSVSTSKYYLEQQTYSKQQ